MRRRRSPFRIAGARAAAALALALGPVAAALPVHGYRVINAFPHAIDAFTQGLLIHEGRLFESVGGYGNSALREVALRSGQVLREHRLPAQRFGEGLAWAEGRLLQLTWRSGVGLIYSVDGFRPLGEFRYHGEGWGLAAVDEERLAASDGTAFLRFLHPRTLAETGRLQVTDGCRPVTGLNELELVEGLLLANVLPTDRIAIIELASGQVTGWLDLQGILPVAFRRPETDVLNGIAYDAKAKRLFVTGKRWPRLFEIEPVPPLPPARAGNAGKAAAAERCRRGEAG